MTRGIAPLFVALCLPVAAAAQTSIQLDKAGKLVAKPAPAKTGAPIQITVDQPPAAIDCLSRRPEGTSVIVRYSYTQDIQQPDILPATSAIAQGAGGLYTIPPSPNGANFVVYNLWQVSASTPEQVSALGSCVGIRRDIEQVLNKDAGAVSAAKDDVSTLQQKTDDKTTDLANLAQEIKDYENVGGAAADRVTDLQRQETVERQQLTTFRQRLKDAQDVLTKAQSALQAEESTYNTDTSTFVGATNRLSDFLAARGADNSYFEAIVLRMGSLLTLTSTQGVYFDLAGRDEHSDTSVTPMGEYPVAHFHDRLFAVLTNVIDSAYSQAFTLQVTAQPGAVVNTSPVRPTFAITPPAGGQEAAQQAVSTITPGSPLYRDVFLPVVGTFAPNDVAQVTIVTERTGSDGKPEKVTIVDAAKFPQYRAEYRYNFTTGVMYSKLHNPTFTKVKTVDDDPSTMPTNEARYRIDEQAGERQVIPVFSLMFYPIPVDIQARVRWERWIPAPTVALAFTNPADDIFIGFSHELVRNAQFYWGWHFGEVRQLVDRNDVSEDQDSTAPVTRNVRKRAMAFGINLNIDVIRQIFK